MTSPPAHSGPRTFVVIGETHLASYVCASLRDGHTVHHLPAPDDQEFRSALAVARLSPSAPTIVTIFDRTVADELTRLLPQCEVTSPADLVARVSPLLPPWFV